MSRIVEILTISANTHHMLNPLHDEELSELSLSKGRYSNWQGTGVIAFAIATIFTLGIATAFFILTAYFKHKEIVAKLNKTPSEEKVSNAATNILENQGNKPQTITQPVILSDATQSSNQPISNESQSSSNQSLSPPPLQSHNAMSQYPIASQQTITINNINHYNLTQETYLKGKAAEWKQLGLQARFTELSKISKELGSTNLAIKRFGDINCPEDTSVKVGDEVLHVNSIQLNNHNFICAQAPLKKTEELFWKAAMQQTQFILDLTNLGKDVLGGVYSYYPENINDYYITGTITIKLVEQIQLIGNPLILISMKWKTKVIVLKN